MDKNKVKETIKLVDQFKNKRDALLELAPFHFNVLDEAGANENSHSKILGKLFKYKENGTSIHLKSFLKNVKLELKVKKPRVYVEKGRIDISILDESYALVIENKIHYAVDQDEQIDKYVELVKKQGYKVKNIYVIYLTRHGVKVPTENSFPKKLRDELGKRYREVNFHSNILPWLTDNVLPSCKHKDKDLIQGIEQYIDHLKGVLNLRQKFKKMNQELNAFLSKELNFIDNDVQGNDEIIAQKIEDLKVYSDQLHNLRIEIRNNLRKQFLKLLLGKLNTIDSGWICVKRINNEINIQDANEQFFGFKNTSYSYKNSNLFFSIEVQNWKKFLCGFCHVKNDLKKELIISFGGKGVELKEGNGGWLALDLDSYSYHSKKPAYFVYDDCWNSLYASDLEGVTGMFFKRIVQVYDAWKEICSKNQKDN